MFDPIEYAKSEAELLIRLSHALPGGEQAFRSALMIGDEIKDLDSAIRFRCSLPCSLIKSRMRVGVHSPVQTGPKRSALNQTSGTMIEVTPFKCNGCGQEWLIHE